MRFANVLPWIATALAAAAVACKDGAAAAPPDAAVPAAPDAGWAQVAVVSAQRTPVRASPDERAKVLTQLNRGERVVALDLGDPFVKVQLSDGATGYLPAKNLVAGSTTEATLTRDQDLYSRPDALSPVKKRLPVGSLLFVLQDKDGWRLVQGADRFQGWVPADKAVIDFPEVETARALWKAELLVEQKKPEAAVALLQECLAANPGTRLAPHLESRLAALPRPDAGVIGDGGTAGSSSSAAPSSSAAVASDAGRSFPTTLVVPQAAGAAGGGDDAGTSSSSGPRPTLVMP